MLKSTVKCQGSNAVGAAYLGFELIPPNGFSRAERHQHQRLIGHIVCVGTVRRRQIGAGVGLRDGISDNHDEDAPKLNDGF